MRILLTGATGFIGSHVARSLVEAGAEVHALVRPNTSLARIADLTDRITIVRGDLSSLEETADSLRDVHADACVHLAWYTQPGRALWAVPENVAALRSSIALIEHLVRTGCRRLVVTGTCIEYDTTFGYLHEDTVVRPNTPYGKAKHALHLVADALASDNDVELAWARVFYVYGPDEDARRLIPGAIEAALANEPFPATHGRQVRDYLHVRDVADALRLVAMGDATGEVNVSSGLPVTVRTILETIENLTGREGIVQFGSLPYNAAEPFFICGANERLQNLGWRPRYTLEEGLIDTVEWWKNRART